MGARSAVNLDLKAPVSTEDLDLLKSLVGSCRKLGMFSYTNMLAKYKDADLPSFVWVGIEEVKRFVIALYKLCIRLSSAGLEDRSLLHAGELQFPLPVNDLLWHSTERHEWEVYAQDENTVSLSELFHEKWISNFADVLQFVQL
ncbi:C2H2 type zinc finger domain protein [Penicillium nucicola]|uniref:C2H2 type zinc finger domain protein n=1 Tax=Penicillium nucicola TaxID=1850975 RepID=UPI002545BAA1|nr:C2H2 type zinc finger domain protein [Penicillium nucicola]KAJ5771113.1 C2H2 type zinc finger domain protein [Penicillium nucicola]